MVRDVVRELTRVLKDVVVVGLEKETGKLPLKSLGKKGVPGCIEVVESREVDFLVVPVIPRFLARMGDNVGLVVDVNFVRKARSAVVFMLFDAIFADSRCIVDI